MFRSRIKKPSLDPLDIKSLRLIRVQTYREISCQECERVYNSQPPVVSSSIGAQPASLTETEIMIVHNDIVKAIDAGNVSARVMLDFGAAFDTVDHCVFIDVLHKHFGVHANALEWLWP